nr:T6SS immunity protein Tli4 family protein [Massilia sp. JS1662]
MKRTSKHGLRKAAVFVLVAGSADDLLQACLSMTMETGTDPGPGGKPAEPGLRQDAVLALWNGIASSVRLRPTRGAPSASEGAPTARFIQPCLQLDKTVCRSGGVMFDSGRFDDAAALKRQATQSPAPDPIAKPVSMLP